MNVRFAASRIFRGRSQVVAPAVMFCAALSILHPALVRSAAATAATAAGDTESLTRQATFIFAGTVIRLGASTMAAVKPTAATAVVRVDEVVDAPGGPPDLVGQEITVQLLAPGTMKAGERAVFFTKGWLLGRSIAVIEVGHAAATQALPRLRRSVQAVRQQAADEQQRDQIATTEAIIAGKVTRVAPAKIPHIGSEHDPDWYEAEIQISSVVKQRPAGIPLQGTVTLLFPHSDDVMWASSPKFHEGQVGIWLLHRNQARLPGIEDRYTALKPLDFRPPEELPRLQRLVKTNG
jgi:hypothetical protein